MKTLVRVFAILLLSAMCLQGAPDENSAKEFFNRKMYSAVPLRGLLRSNPDQFSTLDDGQKQSLLACRDVIVALFQALDTNGDVSKYLTPELHRRLRTASDFLEPETSLMEVGVLNWDFAVEKKAIQLDFEVVVYSEGNWVFSKNTATLEKSTSGWRITKLVWNEK